MEGKLLTHIKVFIPRFNEYPLDKAQKWAERYYSQARHTSGHRRKAVGTQKAVQEKVFDPLLKASEQSINPDFVSKSELTAEQIRSKMRAKMDKTAGKKYLDGLERAFRTVDGVRAKYIKDRLPLGAVKYAEKMTFGTWRLIGPLPSPNPSPSREGKGEGVGKGALSIVLDWLTGVTATPQSLRKQDGLPLGRPLLITDPARRGRFREQLYQCLMRVFSRICVSNYRPDEVRVENNRINQLVTEFARKDLVPFTTGGASHLDFVPQPETAIFYNSPEILAIRSKIQEFFTGKPLDMSKYQVGTDADSFRQMDMHLDIQVASRME